ncbi:MAG: hypothetical protein K0S24_754 [Sphingobacterium sp.]|jgi:hypothetical protein|nr:hypothetical protein [Sphingobacterium sp.]
MIDINSRYYFYDTKGDKHIRIASAGKINNV